jgi:predicted RNA-binding protein (TIGR00451 family)
VRAANAIFGDETDRVLKSLGDPVRTYYVRCNTHKISPVELMSGLKRRGLDVTQNNFIPEAIGIDIKGPFDIRETEKSVIVDKKAAESVLQVANVYAPGIVKCGSMRFGDEITILSELGEVMAVGKAEMSAADVLTFKKGLAITVSERRFQSPQIRELEEFARGLLYPQSLAAMVTTRVLDPKPGETIVDMNCAPGGKLTHMSQLMMNEGRIYGFDRNSHKVNASRETTSKLGCENVVLTIHDSRYLYEDLPNLRADKVLIDPPCSALGLRPKVYDCTTQARIDSLASYQMQFVKAASKIVRPGGVIVYSVCTFTLSECEKVAEFGVSECGLRLVNQNPILGSSGSIEGHISSLCQRFNPYADEIGYFIAKFER